MLYGLEELLASTIREFHGLDKQGFTRWLFVAGGLASLLEIAFFLSGRLVRTDWIPGPLLGGTAAIAFPLFFLLILLFPASSYLKPAVATLLAGWQQSFLADGDWNQGTFEQEYRAVKALKKPDGSPLEDFAQYPPPDQGGHLIPLNANASRATMADVESKRVAEHFQSNFSLLARLLWTQERPLPEVLRDDMERFFTANPGNATYEHAKSVKLAGVEMLNLLEQKIGRIVLVVRISITFLLVAPWLILCLLAGRDAWKKLDPIT